MNETYTATIKQERISLQQYDYIVTHSDLKLVEPGVSVNVSKLNEGIMPCSNGESPKHLPEFIKCDKIIKDTDNPYYMRITYYVLSGYIFDLFAEFFEENIEDYVGKEVCEWF